MRHTISVEKLAGYSAEAHIASSMSAEDSHKRLIVRIPLDTLKPVLQVFRHYDELILETDNLAEAVEAYNKEL